MSSRTPDGDLVPVRPSTVAAELRRDRFRRIIGRASLYLVLVVGTVVFTLPTLWMIATSFKHPAQASNIPPEFIPNPFQLDGYTISIRQFPVVQALRNTMVIEVGVLAGRLLSATLVAYGFARLRFPFRGPIFVLVLCTMMIPYHVTLIPQYAFFRQLGWLNTPFPLIVPAWFGGGAFYIFLLRQFFLTIHRETDDAARIDGCGYFGIYWHVIVPMSLPALGTLTIFTFLAEWNDFLAPLIYLNDQETQTLAIAISKWQIDDSALTRKTPTFPQIMAMSLVITIPPVLVFFFLQRHFIQGIVVTGVKG